VRRIGTIGNLSRDLDRSVETNPALRRHIPVEWTPMDSKSDRVQLEMKIIKYRTLARQTSDEVTKKRIDGLIAELEQKLREIDE
jgi:hypothetical protein